jgi:glycosyltransferase involved in cell wall biosynthesis
MRKRKGVGPIDMNQDEDTVGVVVPMYNAERTIASTLRSVSEQTHGNLDIVVVDDGSTDGSAAVVRKWQARDQRVRLVQQANAGVSMARNAGAAATSAQFLAFVDADDVWAPTKIEYQLRTLQTGGSAVGLVYCWYATIGTDDRIVTLGPQPLDEGWVLRQLCGHNVIGNGSTLLVRRSTFEAAGGYDPSLRARGVDGAEDFLICLRLAEQGEFRVVPRYLVGYRQMPGSMSTYSLRMFRASSLALQEYRTRFPEYTREIDAQLQDFRQWFAWGALRQREWRDAAILYGEGLAAHPVATPLRFANMLWATLKGRLFRKLGLHQPYHPLYTETIW